MREPPNSPVSKWAFKYGKMEDAPNHSGYTPLAYSFPTLGTLGQAASSLKPHDVQQFQRRMLKGFTSNELSLLDCLPTRDILPGNLQNEIIPLFRRVNWQDGLFQPDLTHDKIYALKDGDGHWIASNDKVWGIMEPILRLASQIISSSHLLPWFDALVNGEREEVPENRINASDMIDENGDELDFTLQTFWPNANGHDLEALARQRATLFEILIVKHEYKFGFMIPYEHPGGPEQGEMDAPLALTFTNRSHMLYDKHIANRKPRVFTFLDLSYPEMLFRGDLTITERMQIQWSVANTLIHEVMHAIGMLATDLAGNFVNNEVYFEKQPVAELGFSYEDAMNIGQTEPMIQKDPPESVPPFGFWLRRFWPDFNDCMCSEMPTLKNPGPLYYNELYPIPVSFYQDMQQEEFWSIAVKNYGPSVLHYRAVKQGSRVFYWPNDAGEMRRTKPQRISFDDHPFTTLNDRFRNAMAVMSTVVDMSPEDRKAVAFGRGFLMSSNLETQFWDDSYTQKLAVENALQTMAQAVRGTSSKAAREAAVKSLCTILQGTIINHERMIAGILSMEELNATTYPDRRGALRTWNQGTRRFFRAIENKKNIDVSVEEELLRLERARMVLWNPKDLAYQNGRDWDEFISIQQFVTASEADSVEGARAFKAIRIKVMSAPDCSLFAQCALDVLYFQKTQRLPHKWDEKMASLMIAGKRLELLQAGAPAGWKEDVDALYRIALQLKDKQKPDDGLPYAPSVVFLYAGALYPGDDAADADAETVPAILSVEDASLRPPLNPVAQTYPRC